MRFKSLLGLAVAAAVIAALPGLTSHRIAAQSMKGGTLPPGMMAEGARAMTPFEIFADRLDLDDKTQTPAVREIFLSASQEAAAPARELLQIRQRLLNIDLGNQPETERPAAMDAYKAAATRIAQIEANTMNKVFALLKPNQHNKVPNAFAALQGMFQIGAPSGRGRG